MPRAGWVKPQDDQRLSDHVALGVLTRTFPPQLVDAVVRETGREQRRHRLLPSRLVVYYVLGLALFSQAGYEEVMRNLVEGLSWESGWRQSWTVPSQPAISQARARLGVEPLAELFARGCVPLASEQTPGAFWRGRRLMAIDGTVLDLPDTAENARAFGRPASGRGEGSAFPQLRLVGLAECGTHALVDVAMGACTQGETTLARGLLASLGPAMLVLADRNFFSFALWDEAAATGADLLWRTKSNHSLPVDERLGDGSYLSHIQANDDNRRRPKNPVTVRVVEYGVDDPGRPQAEGSTYRLITTILDPEAGPADEVAGLYPERWEFETSLDELKTHQRGPRVVLRSKSPDGVRQEAYGYLCTHYAIRALMHAASASEDVDPDRISFTRALHAARRSVRAGLGVATRSLAVALTATLAEVRFELLAPRRVRANPRVVKRKMSKFNLKRAAHRDWPQPSRSAAQAVRVLNVPARK